MFNLKGKGKCCTEIGHQTKFKYHGKAVDIEINECK